MSPYGYELIAKHGAHCPLCPRYIAKNRSRIAPLDLWLFPQPHRCAFDAERRRAWLLDGYPLQHGLRPYQWGHERCVERWMRRHPTAEERQMIAHERLLELRRMKDEAIRMHREAEAAWRKRSASTSRKRKGMASDAK